MELPPGWVEFYSPRARAPYYYEPASGITNWIRPTSNDAGEHVTKRLRTEESSEIARLQAELEKMRTAHAAEIAALKATSVLAVRTGVEAGHNAQHGHVGALSASIEDPLPLTPAIKEEHDPTFEKTSKWTRADLIVNDTLRDIYRNEQVMDASGQTHKFEDGVDPLEGKHLYNIVLDNPRFTRTCEVGCAMGTSALYLCQALSDGKRNERGALHVAVDPNQDTQYKVRVARKIMWAGNVPSLIHHSFV